jgi:hypothetical protein
MSVHHDILRNPDSIFKDLNWTVVTLRWFYDKEFLTEIKGMWLSLGMLKLVKSVNRVIIGTLISMGQDDE